MKKFLAVVAACLLAALFAACPVDSGDDSVKIPSYLKDTSWENGSGGNVAFDDAHAVIGGKSYKIVKIEENSSRVILYFSSEVDNDCYIVVESGQITGVYFVKENISGGQWVKKAGSPGNDGGVKDAFVEMLKEIMYDKRESDIAGSLRYEFVRFKKDKNYIFCEAVSNADIFMGDSFRISCNVDKNFDVRPISQYCYLILTVFDVDKDGKENFSGSSRGKSFNLTLKENERNMKSILLLDEDYSEIEYTAEDLKKVDVPGLYNLNIVSYYLERHSESGLLNNNSYVEVGSGGLLPAGKYYYYFYYN
jgi:hypothetical protein